MNEHDAQTDRHQRIEKIVQDFRKTLPSKYRDRIANRSEEVEEARLEELGNGDLPLSPKSLEDFVALWDRDSSLEYPILTLTPGGHLFAEWESNGVTQ